MWRIGFVIAAGSLFLAACGDDEPTGAPIETIPAHSSVPTTTAPAAAAVPIVERFDDVDYYIACADVPVEVDGVTWYPVSDWGPGVEQLYDEITSVDREAPGGPIGFAPAVAPPGPGDDVGTVWVYADGYALFESDSGQTIWLTQEELTYDWVC